MQATTDAQFTCQSRRVAKAFALAKTAPIYRYVFTRGQENDPALKANGVGHTIEHAFLFPGRYRASEAEAALQQLMTRYWTRMAKTGNPNGGDDPQWPPVTPSDDAYLELGTSTAGKIALLDRTCDFWDTITFAWPHL